MPSLKKILRNIEQYSPEELAAFVRNGDCTVYQLNKSGYLSPLVKRRIETLVAAGDEQPAAEVAEATPSPSASASTMHPAPDRQQAAAQKAAAQAQASPRTTIVDLSALYQAAHPEAAQFQGAQQQGAPQQVSSQYVPPAPATDPDARRRAQGIPDGMPPIPDGDNSDSPLHPGMIIEPKNLFD